MINIIENEVKVIVSLNCESNGGEQIKFVTRKNPHKEQYFEINSYYNMSYIYGTDLLYPRHFLELADKIENELEELHSKNYKLPIDKLLKTSTICFGESKILISYFWNGDTLEQNRGCFYLNQEIIYYKSGFKCAKVDLTDSVITPESARKIANALSFLNT